MCTTLGTGNRVCREQTKMPCPYRGYSAGRTDRQIQYKLGKMEISVWRRFNRGEVMPEGYREDLMRRWHVRTGRGTGKNHGYPGDRSFQAERTDSAKTIRQKCIWKGSQGVQPGAQGSWNRMREGGTGRWCGDRMYRALWITAMTLAFMPSAWEGTEWFCTKK